MSDVLPPPPPARAGDSCWKWGGITCGVGCFLLVVLMILLGPTCKRALEAVMKGAEEAEQARQEMVRVWNQAEKYYRQTGKYPAKLEDLVPKYLASEQLLRFSRNPDGPKFAYHRPDPDDPDTTIVMEYAVRMEVGGSIMLVPVRLQKNGQIDTSR